ncbi:MAG: class I SAM-dependent methyltransferase [Acidimicrobiia bacterium]
MNAEPDFEALVEEAEAAPVDGWGFGWLDGRAVEQRPSWGYAGLLVRRVERARRMLDLQTGGAEVLTEVLERASARPSVIGATESWPPNLAIAHQNLSHHVGTVVRTADAQALPFRTATFDLVSSRHPVVTRWDEVARVLTPGGTYFAQHVGSGSNRELTDFLMGPQPISGARDPSRAAEDARAHGLEVVDLRDETLTVEFHDVGAVVYFLRKVIWTVPDFTVARYRDRLARMHDRIRAEGRFVSHARRFLIELRRP